MKTLYELTNEYEDIRTMLDEDNEEEIKEKLNAIVMSVEDKVRNGIGLIRDLQGDVEKVDAEIKRLVKIKQSQEKNIEWLKNYYLDNLRYIGKSKVVTPIGTMTVAKAGGKRKMVIDDENLVPADFKFTRYEEVIDKDALRDSLENGEVIEGAHLEERGQYLKIN